MANMPSEAWYFVIAGLVIVLALAIWKGRGIRIRKGSITVDAVRETPATGISVAAGVRIEGSSVGDITGVSISGKAATPAAKVPVDVLRGGTVKDATVGDVTGVKQDEGTSDRR